MISLALSFAFLVFGFLFYSRIAEKAFSPDDRPTPAITINDGVDCIPLKSPKAFLVQLLNIAGTGPIFGALMGAQFGPCVYLWIVLGCVFGGAVHDYMVGMISCRNEGKSLAELAGIYLGKYGKYVVRILSLLILILVGTVFITSPAALLAKLTDDKIGTIYWVILIIVYYVLATLLPIDKLIGRLYPVFGLVLLIMAGGILGTVLFSGKFTLPEIQLTNLHPDGQPVWPYMFVTVACGAISGFHATQSPMISKCITSEKKGRNIFYGAMITEGVIALIWATAGVVFYETTGGLSAALQSSGQSGVVYDISISLLGKFGGLLAVFGVVACPITSGDTAFRSARLIISEWTGLNQKKFVNRLVITIPLLLIGAVLSNLNFDVLWRYSSWSNQVLAMTSLWVSSSYLMKHGKNAFSSLITAIPAAFMSAVSMTYILISNEGFRLAPTVSYIVGTAFAAALFCIYAFYLVKQSCRLKLQS